METKDYLENHWIRKKVWTHLKWPKHQNRLKTCASYLEGKRFIDVGCGLGHSTVALSKFSPGIWSGLEFWEGAVIQARKLFPEIEFYYSKDFSFLPICGEFDSVVCSEVIEHVKDDQALIDGLMSITKNTLVITTPSIKVRDPGHLRLYTEGILSKLFNNYIFEIIEKDTFFYIVARRENK